MFPGVRQPRPNAPRVVLEVSAEAINDGGGANATLPTATVTTRTVAAVNATSVNGVSTVTTTVTTTITTTLTTVSRPEQAANEPATV